MKMMRNLYKFILTSITGVMIWSGAATAAPFIEGFEDIPIMKGLKQVQNDNISFGNEETRFVEAILTGSKVGFKSVEKFYTDTLPQLGWVFQGRRGDTLIFYRESESLEIVKESSKPLNVRITVKSRM